MTREQERLGALLYPNKHNRPTTRGQCFDVPRPCLFVGCAYNLYLDVNPNKGSIKLNFPDLEPGEMNESCALDVAGRGEHTLEECADLMNLTRERIRQFELMLFPLLEADANVAKLHKETSDESKDRSDATNWTS